MKRKERKKKEKKKKQKDEPPPKTIPLDRMSQLARNSHKDFEFEFYMFSEEAQYSNYWGGSRMWQWFRMMPDNTLWNSLMCCFVLFGIIMSAGSIYEHSIFAQYWDMAYNIVYGVNTLAMIYEFKNSEFIKQTWGKKIALFIDFVSYLNFPLYYFFGDEGMTMYIVLLSMYYIRLNRPIRYLWTLTQDNMKGSVMGTFLKYMYLFIVARITFAIYFMIYDIGKVSSTLDQLEHINNVEDKVAARLGKFFLYCYVVDKLFLPIGPDVVANDSHERMSFVALMICGTLLAAGAAVASMSLVICLYMKPEEYFRARFKLIMKDINVSGMPKQLRDKVKTFYEMYWLRQKCVSVTQLMPIFPPTLPASIYTDIYFEALQKSPILRDLSYPFLWELSKMMSTIHYIPGDAVISRGSTKSYIIYLDYGDMEMVSAEDDDSPLMRMTRGSIITPLGGCMAVACTTSHVQIRAATYCVAHVLAAEDLWRVASKYGKLNGQTFILLSSFQEIMGKIKKHYVTRVKQPVKYKSSIVQFKRNILALKELKTAKNKLVLRRDDYFLLIAGCYVMRNKSDYEEADEICLRPMFPCVFKPTSNFLFAWHVFTSFLILIITIHYPYQILFKGEITREFLFFDHIMTVVYVMDLYIHLSTGHCVEEGMPITFGNTSERQVSDPWFALDVVATLPILMFVGNGELSGLNKLLRLPKLFRVLKYIEDLLVYHRNVLRFLSYSTMVFLICYLMGAYHHAVVCYINEKCLVNNFTHYPHWSYATPEEIATKGVRDGMYFAFYFSISIITFTSTSTEPLYESPVKTLVLAAIVLEISCIIMIFIQAVYSATITVTSLMRYDYDACIENVKNFLVRNRMDPLLRQRFIKYLQLCWYTDKAYSITHQKRSILYDLPPHVYQDIMARQRIKYILCLPFMNFVSQEQVKIVASHMRLFYTSPNEVLLNTGDVSNEIYIIRRGFCEVYDPDSKEVVDVIGEMKIFGLLECLMRCPVFYTVRAVTHVQIFSVAGKHLKKSLEVGRINEVIESVKAEEQFKSVSVRREPFKVYIEPPLATNRQIFPLPRKHIPDAAFLYPFAGLGFLSVLRYVFPRFTIRPDGKYIMRYEMFRGVCAFTSAMVYPSYSYLLMQWPSLWYLAWVLDLTGYIDMLQRLLVGYYDEEGILVYHPATTATHYIKGAFMVDLLACLPLEYLEYDRMDSPGQKRSNRFLSTELQQLLMLNRLIQLYRIVSAMEFINNYIERRDVILAIKAIPLIMVMLNVVTCLMILYSVDIYGPPIYDTGDENKAWLIVFEDDPGGSWLQLFDGVLGFDQAGSPWNLHVTVYFWVVFETITTGYGVLAPSSKELLITLSLGMFAGSMIITFFSVLVISMRSNVNQVLANFQENMQDITIFMRREKLNPDLQKEVLNYYNYNWEKMGGLDYRQVLSLCDQISLRTDAILHIYGDIFEKCPILQHCDTSLLRVLGRAVYNLYYLMGTTIIEIDDVISDLFIIDYGEINMVEYKGAYSSIHKLLKGSVFGNLEPRATYRCSSKVVAMTNVHLLKINTLSFHTIIADFPTVSVLLKKYRPNRENFITGNEHEYQHPTGSTANTRMRSPSDVRQVKSPVADTKTKILSYLSADSRFVQVYLIIVCLADIYCDVYNAGFGANTGNLILALYILDLLFFVKIIMFLVLPSMMSRSEEKLNVVIARKFYVQGEFKYDLMSLLPIEAFSFISSKYQWKLFSILRLNRMVRCMTIHKCLQRHRRRLSVNLVLSTLVMVFIWFTVFVHSTTCVWYSIGVYGELFEKNSSWMGHLGDIHCDNMYVCSMYFVLTTFTHNGLSDFVPQQHIEVLFAVVLQVASSLIFMVYVGEFSNIIQYMSFRAFSFYSQFLELQEFMKNNKVSTNLVKMVNRYTLHLWRETRGLQIPEFLDMAPQCFKLKLMNATYLYLIEEHPYFRVCEQSFQRQLAGCMVMYTYCEGIFVVKQGEITDAMYLIHRGEVEELDQLMEEAEIKGNVHKKGDCIGSKNGLVRDTPYLFSYRARMDAQVLTLQLDKWEYLLHHFPRSRYLIYKNIADHEFGRREYSSMDDGDGNPPTDTITLPVGTSHPSQEHIPEFARSNTRRSTVYGAYLPFSNPPVVRRETRPSIKLDFKLEAVTEQPQAAAPRDGSQPVSRSMSVESFEKIRKTTFIEKVVRSLNEDDKGSEDELEREEQEAAAAAFTDILIESGSESDTPHVEDLMPALHQEKPEKTRHFSFLPGLVEKDENVQGIVDTEKQGNVESLDKSMMLSSGKETEIPSGAGLGPISELEDLGGLTDNRGGNLTNIFDTQTESPPEIPTTTTDENTTTSITVPASEYIDENLMEILEGDDGIPADRSIYVGLPDVTDVNLMNIEHESPGKLTEIEEEKKPATELENLRGLLTDKRGTNLMNIFDVEDESPPEKSTAKTEKEKKTVTESDDLRVLTDKRGTNLMNIFDAESPPSTSVRKKKKEEKPAKEPEPRAGTSSGRSSNVRSTGTSSDEDDLSPYPIVRPLRRKASDREGELND